MCEFWWWESVVWGDVRKSKFFIVFVVVFYFFVWIWVFDGGWWEDDWSGGDFGWERKSEYFFVFVVDIRVSVRFVIRIGVFVFFGFGDGVDLFDVLVFVWFGGFFDRFVELGFLFVFSIGEFNYERVEEVGVID